MSEALSKVVLTDSATTSEASLGEPHALLGHRRRVRLIDTHFFFQRTRHRRPQKLHEIRKVVHFRRPELQITGPVNHLTHVPQLARVRRGYTQELPQILLNARPRGHLVSWCPPDTTCRDLLTPRRATVNSRPSAT